MVTLFLEKEENNINVMDVGLFLNIGNTGKIKNICFKWAWIVSDYKSISIDVGCVHLFNVDYKRAYKFT